MHKISCIHIDFRKWVVYTYGGLIDATHGWGRVSHVCRRRIGIFVFDILKIHSGFVQVCSGCIAPTCNSLVTGLHEKKLRLLNFRNLASTNISNANNDITVFIKTSIIYTTAYALRTHRLVNFVFGTSQGIRSFWDTNTHWRQFSGFSFRYESLCFTPPTSRIKINFGIALLNILILCTFIRLGIQRNDTITQYT
jgi:hypothetical protein